MKTRRPRKCNQSRGIEKGDDAKERERALGVIMPPRSSSTTFSLGAALDVVVVVDGVAKSGIEMSSFLADRPAAGLLSRIPSFHIKVVYKSAAQ